MLGAALRLDRDYDPEVGRWTSKDPMKIVTKWDAHESGGMADQMLKKCLKNLW